MSARVKFTDQQIATVRSIVNQRRELARQIRELPSLEQLAEQLGCSKRYLEKIVSNHVRTGPRETTARPSIESFR